MKQPPTKDTIVLLSMPCIAFLLLVFISYLVISCKFDF